MKPEMHTSVGLLQHFSTISAPCWKGRPAVMQLSIHLPLHMLLHISQFVSDMVSFTDICPVHTVEGLNDCDKSIPVKPPQVTSPPGTHAYISEPVAGNPDCPVAEQTSIAFTKL